MNYPNIAMNLLEQADIIVTTEDQDTFKIPEKALIDEYLRMLQVKLARRPFSTGFSLSTFFNINNNWSIDVKFNNQWIGWIACDKTLKKQLREYLIKEDRGLRNQIDEVRRVLESAEMRVNDIDGLIDILDGE